MIVPPAVPDEEWGTQRIQHASGGYCVRDILELPEKLFDDTPKFGLVIGTFAAVPYVHLQLEAHKRLYPHVKMLVHDDASPCTKQLAALCESYGVEFEHNEERCKPTLGDLSAFLGGLVWARQNHLDILVKLSRRFVPLTDWTDSLAQLALESQYATYSSWTETFNFGFRSECTAIAVNEWWRLRLCEEIGIEIARNNETFVERFIHNLGRRAARYNCVEARRYDQRVGARPPERNGYACWAFMGTDRVTRSHDYLWHDWAQPQDYWATAQAWGLPYLPADFADPNQGFGDRPGTRTTREAIAPLAPDSPPSAHAGVSAGEAGVPLVPPRDDRPKSNKVV